MSGDEQGYNGWQNYETWSVALIINNDQQLQEDAYQLTKDTIEQGEPSEYWTEEERKRYRVADALKDWVERWAEDAVVMDDMRPFSYLWGQLISAALSDVNWHELADAFIADTEETDR